MFQASDFQAGAAYTSGTATWSVAMPADVQADDWLYLVITTNTDHTVSTINGSTATGTPLVADGWEEIVHNTGTGADGFSIWEKKHDGAEADPAVVVFSGTEVGVGYIFRVRNAATTSPRGQLFSGTSATTTTSVTPPGDDHAILAVVHQDPASATTLTWADATEMVDAADGGNAVSAAAYFIQTTAAAKAIAYTPNPAATLGFTIWEMEPGASGANYTGPPAGVGQVNVSGTATVDYQATTAYSGPPASAEPLEVCGNASFTYTSEGTAYTAPTSNGILEIAGTATADYLAAQSYTGPPAGGGGIELKGRVVEINYSSGNVPGPLRRLFYCRPNGDGTFTCRPSRWAA